MSNDATPSGKSQDSNDKKIQEINASRQRRLAPCIVGQASIVVSSRAAPKSDSYEQRLVLPKDEEMKPQPYFCEDASFTCEKSDGLLNKVLQMFEDTHSEWEAAISTESVYVLNVVSYANTTQHTVTITLYKPKNGDGVLLSVSGMGQENVLLYDVVEVLKGLNCTKSSIGKSCTPRSSLMSEPLPLPEDLQILITDEDIKFDLDNVVSYYERGVQAQASACDRMYDLLENCQGIVRVLQNDEETLTKVADWAFSGSQINYAGLAVVNLLISKMDLEQVPGFASKVKARVDTANKSKSTAFGMRHIYKTLRTMSTQL